jgi:putative transcriptional regulator
MERLARVSPARSSQQTEGFIVLNTSSDFKRLVQALRGRTGLTQEQFAARLGVTFPTVSRWENGHTKPSPLALRQIQTLLQELGESAEVETPPNCAVLPQGVEPPPAHTA